LSTHSKSSPTAHAHSAPAAQPGPSVSPTPSNGLPLDRREFIATGTGLVAGAALFAAGCQPPAENSIPFVEQPEGMRTQGRAKTYATVHGDVPVLVRTREGRPLLIGPNPRLERCPAPSVRTQAALLDLYDPDRAPGPLSVRRGQGAPVAADWRVVGDALARSLRSKAGKVALLIHPQSGPATLALLRTLTTELGVRVVAYAPLAHDAQERVARAAFGASVAPRPRLDRARLIVGFGARFIDAPELGLERDFATGHHPDAADGMSRFIQLEGRLSLTGANADQRWRVRDSELGLVAGALAHRLVVELGRGPRAADSTLRQALGPYSAAAVAAQTGLTEKSMTGLADELGRHAGRSIVLGGGSGDATLGGEALAALIVVINEALGNYASPCFEATSRPSASDAAEFVELIVAMRERKLEALVIAGPNPVYDAPPSLDFAEAMASVPLVVSLNDRLDETSQRADFLAPASHPLEAWGDATLGLGLIAVQQPVLRPLYDTLGLLDILVTLGAAADPSGALAAAATAARPDARGAPPSGSDSPGYHFVRTFWQRSGLASTSQWDDVLRAGFVAGPALPALAIAPGFGADVAALLAVPRAPSPPLELELYPHFALHDGQSANNGWLLELPDPITRLCWGGAASIAPRRFDALGLKNGDLVELGVDGHSLVLPAYRHAGMHHDQIAVPLGLGRTACGPIGAHVGHNAFVLRTVTGARIVQAGLAVTLKKAQGHEALASGQGADVLDRAPRPLVPTTTLAEYHHDRRAGTEQPEGDVSAWPTHEYKTQRWGMSIDLSLCNGCGKCVLGCQAENNIPVVGKPAMLAGRAMSWMRIDRYYDAPKKLGGWDDTVWDGPLAVVEEPVPLFEPMLCQHCENAPCETVCPFNATLHSEDGLNQQVYNRCVGTRYCANNCPFKVRRYNWFEYSRAHVNRFFAFVFPEIVEHAVRNTRGRMQMKNNPEVTVRSRGVMEKCSFCVQRIREARAAAIREGHQGQLADGSVTPACAEACPTGAIVFGDLNDPTSRVHALAKDPRAMRLLAALGVKPSISYLTKVRHEPL